MFRPAVGLVGALSELRSTLVEFERFHAERGAVGVVVVVQGGFVAAKNHVLLEAAVRSDLRPGCDRHRLLEAARAPAGFPLCPALGRKATRSQEGRALGDPNCSREGPSAKEAKECPLAYRNSLMFQT